MGPADLERDIAAGERLLLDTTVLAAYLDTTEVVSPVAIRLLDDFVRPGRNHAVISMVTVMEILVRPMRLRPRAHQTVLGFLQHHPNLEAVPLDIQMAQDAAMLRADHRFSPPDALVVATGVECQVDHLVTNDKAWAGKLANMQTRIHVRTLADYLPFQ